MDYALVVPHVCHRITHARVHCYFRNYIIKNIKKLCGFYDISSLTADHKYSDTNEKYISTIKKARTVCAH